MAMPRKSIEEGLNISVTTDINMETAAQLVALAKKDKRSKAFIIREAIDMYVRSQHPQTQEWGIGHPQYDVFGMYGDDPFFANGVRPADYCSCGAGEGRRHTRYAFIEGATRYYAHEVIYFSRERNIVLTVDAIGSSIHPYSFYICEKCQDLLNNIPAIEVK